MRTTSPNGIEHKVLLSPHRARSRQQQQQQRRQQQPHTQQTPPHDLVRAAAMLQSRGAPLLAPTPSRQQPLPLRRAESTNAASIDSKSNGSGIAAVHAHAHCTLEITQQPPPKWYKDQFGRKATFEFHLRRVGSGCSACAEQRHLSVQLLYENGKTVENQTILRIPSGLCLGKNNESVVAVRIMEVSKNHQNQRFRLRIALPQCPLAGVIPAPAVTDSVLVLSKKNKRPSRSEGDDAQATPSRPKRSRAADSPALAASSPRRAHSPIRGHASSSTPSSVVPDEFSPAMPDAASWASQAVRFTAPSASVCLWANAAYNFLHKLQWQRPHGTTTLDGGDDEMETFLSHASAMPYECPVCHERYGAAPKHRADCDLSLLLEQSGAFDNSPTGSKPEQPPPPPRPALQTAFGSSAQPLPLPFESPAHAPRNGAASTTPRTTAARALNLTQEFLQFSESPSDDAKPAPALASSSLDALARNLNLDSWEGYSTLSRIMFSTTLDMDGASAAQLSPVSLQDRLLRPGALPVLTPHAPAPAPPPPPSSFSNLVSSMKHMPPDAAALLQEQDAELNGDASLLCSLSRVSLSDFLNSEAAVAVPKADPRFLATLSSLLADEHAKRPVSEDAVAVVIAADFRHCGLPAFDDSFALLGFYFPTGSAGTSDLRFLPNFYPLPPEMLQELEQSVSAWRTDGLLMVARGTTPTGAVEPLAQLKQRVLERMASQK